MGKIAERIVTVLTDISNAIGSSWIMVIMLIITVDVCGREIFHHSITGTAEIVSNSITSIAFLQTAYVLSKGRHVRATVFYDKAGFMGKKILDLLSYLIGLVLFALMTYSAWGMFLKSYRNHEFEGGGAFRLTSWPFRLIIVIGAALMTMQFIRLIICKVLEKEVFVPAGGQED